MLRDVLKTEILNDLDLHDRIDRLVEVNSALAVSDGLQHSSLSAAASHEVELGVVEQVLEFLARLPLNLHLVDVLRRKLVGSLCALGAEQEREVTQINTRIFCIYQILACDKERFSAKHFRFETSLKIKLYVLWDASLCFCGIENYVLQYKSVYYRAIHRLRGMYSVFSIQFFSLLLPSSV